jgi:GNAT superfamily N-acetyltransferase
MKTEQTKLKVVTLQDNPSLEEVFWPYKQNAWPKFLLHDVYSDRLWDYTSRFFPAFQVYLLDGSDEPVACGHSIPCVWDGTITDLPVGWGDCLVKGAYGCERKSVKILRKTIGRERPEPNTLALLEITVRPEYRGQGVSYQMLKVLRTIAEEHGLQAMIAAVRPTMKSKYPTIPMERYAYWRREDGAPFDPWLRVHWRNGAEIIKVANPSMIITASVEKWEEWTGMVFPESGHYVIPEALVPLQIDRVANVGNYVEPNVWMHHPITSKRLTRA